MSAQRDGLSPIEEALAALRPAACGPDRDRLMWEAGRASRRTPTAWPIATALLAVAVAALAAWPREAPAPRVVERVVYVTRDPAPAVPVSLPPVAAAPQEQAWQPAGPGYLELRRAVLARGVDAIPEGPGGGGGAPQTLGDLLREGAG